MKQYTFTIYLLVGFLSGVGCWLGGYVLPEGSFVLKIYPGLVLGTALYLVGNLQSLTDAKNSFLNYAIIVVATVVGWRLAVDYGYDLIRSAPFLMSGALGAFVTGIGLVMIWKIRNFAVLFFVVVTGAGALGGQVFHFITLLFPDMGEDLWMVTLFVQWQIVFMMGIWIALKLSKRTRDIFDN